MTEYTPPNLDILSQSLLQFQDGQPDNADLDMRAFDDDIYAEGYKHAAEFLIDNIEKLDINYTRHPQDFVIYPIMFLYRHYLELRLKDIIYLLRKYYFLPYESISGHSLIKLWYKIRRPLEQIGDPMDIYNDQIEARIKELNDMDPNSVSFRYSKTKDNTPTLQNYRRLSPSHIKIVMNELSKCLDTISIGLSGTIDQSDVDMRYEYGYE